MLIRCCALVLIATSFADAQLGKSSDISFPRNRGEYYGKNVVRTWTKSSSDGYCVRFQITSLDIESSRNCANDHLEVFDGDNAHANRLQRTCGTTIPKPVVTTSSKFHVVFRSDGNEETGEGFMATIKTVRCSSGGGGSDGIITPARTCGKPAIAPNETAFHVAARHRRQNAWPPVMFGDGESPEPGMRIVGGQPARDHSWPWQVSIRFRGNHICGGSLVSATHIISAAHCFKTVSTAADEFEFWVGKHLKDDREPAYEQQLFGSEIILHEDYMKKKHDSDLAIIRLSTPARFTKYVSPICLPSSQSQHPQDETKCYVTGFGTTMGTGNADRLKQAAVPVLNNDECKSMEARLKPLLTKNMFCAGYYQGGHDSCQGDSGGPLNCKVGEQNSWVLSGVVSFGFGCAGANSPGVYVRTAEFLPWFRKHISDL